MSKKIKNIIKRIVSLVLAVNLAIILFPSFEKKTKARTKLPISSDEVKFYSQNIGDLTNGNNKSFSISTEKIRENYCELIGNIDFCNSDFILLQESDWYTPVNNFFNASKQLCRNLDEYSFQYGSNYNVFNVHNCGNLFLSRYRATFELLRIPFRIENPIDDIFINHKLVIKCTVDIENSDSKLIIYNCHLTPYEENREIKYSQIDYLMNTAQADYENGNYVVIMGDFNSHSKTISKRLKNGFRLIIDEDGNNSTYYNDENGKYSVLDNCIISPNLELIVCNVPHFTTYSDHAYISLTLRLNQK